MANLLMAADVVSEVQARAEHAFRFAQETSKQVLALATGLVGITIAFVDDLKKAVNQSALGLLHAAWICAGVSGLFGIVTLMALTGQIARGKRFDPEAVYSKTITFAFLVQLGTFIAALGLTVTFGVKGT